MEKYTNENVPQGYEWKHELPESIVVIITELPENVVKIRPGYYRDFNYDYYLAWTPFGKKVYYRFEKEKRNGSK